MAGPKSLEHLVDVVLEFSGASGHPHRILRATKNRFGPAIELALFAMSDAGLEEIANPSAALLADRRAGAPGSAVAVVLEGTTPLLVEVQALVSRSLPRQPPARRPGRRRRPSRPPARGAREARRRAARPTATSSSTWSAASASTSPRSTSRSPPR